MPAALGLAAVAADLRSLAAAAAGREGIAGQLAGLFTGGASAAEHAAVRAAADKALAALTALPAGSEDDASASEALSAAVEVSGRAGGRGSGDGA
jgi:hypothetical protein